MKYKVERTDTADSLIRKMILFIAENFGSDVALEKLDYLEESIMNLWGDNPYIGMEPRYNVLKLQGYLVCHVNWECRKNTEQICRKNKTRTSLSSAKGISTYAPKSQSLWTISKWI